MSEKITPIANNKPVASITWDTGYRTFETPLGEIRFNPFDFDLIARWEEGEKRLQSFFAEDPELIAAANSDVDENTDEGQAILDKILEASQFVKDTTDYMFGAEISKTIYGTTHPLSYVDGSPVFQLFIEAAYPVILEFMEESAKKSQKKVDKYTKHNKKKK